MGISWNALRENRYREVCWPKIWTVGRRKFLLEQLLKLY
jgi:hypothetical protein